MKTIIVLAAAAAVISAAPASAQPSSLDDNTYRVVIPYGDLNLDSAKGMKTLQRRINAGSDSACTSRSQFNMSQWDDIERCKQHFLSEAQQQVDVVTRKGSVTVIAGSK